VKLASRREQYTADKFISLFGELVKRDLRKKYRRSVLGYFWSLLNPLMMMAVMMVVFSYMFRFEIENYPLYLICGQTMFNFFNESTNMSLYSIIDNGTLLKKIYVPKYVFPISRVLSCFVTMSFSLVAILIVMVVTRVQFHLTVLLFWAPMAYLLVFCSGMGLLVSSLAVRFRDVIHLYSVLTMLWMYATPVFYPIEAVPPQVAALIRLNPMYVFITLFRELLLYGRMPGVGMWLSGAGMAALVFALGAWVFSRLQKTFIYYI
jgi:ABC-2 type transport system permease protein